MTAADLRALIPAAHAAGCPSWADTLERAARTIDAVLAVLEDEAEVLQGQGTLDHVEYGVVTRLTAEVRRIVVAT